MKKRVLAALAAAAISMSTVLAGCAQTSTETTASASASATATATAAREETVAVNQTLTYYGTVKSTDADGTIVIESEQDGEIACKTDASTIFISTVTGREAELSDVNVGDYVSAAVSPAMTRSVPPQSVCYAFMLDVPESGNGTAHYVQVSAVESDADGALAVMDQNDDVIIALPASLPIELLGSDETAAHSEIRTGSKLIIWYDAVALSMPGKATALRAVYCP